MNRSDFNPRRSERLRFLVQEQNRVRCSRLRRRNAGAVAMLVLILAGVIWMAAPTNQPVAVSPNQQASSTPEQADPLESAETGQATFRVTRIEDRPLTLVRVVRRAEPQRVQMISDIQLYLAMREQGIDAGFIRVDGQTQLAFNDEQSRRRFEEAIDSPK